MNEARVDKWLWAARIFKTRSMAAAACKKGQVSMNGAQLKPSRTVKVFLKEASAPDSSFGAPQAVYTDVDTYGYAAMTIEPTGTAYFYATNYSVINIDPMIGREV